MKKSNFCLIILLFYLVVSAYSQTAEIISRPLWVDISSADSKSAVLIRLSGYISDDVRYRLYNGSNYYYCWNSETGSYITSNSYSSGPLSPGTPTTETNFWIMYMRGSNNSVSATYRDRLGPDYGNNYQTVTLPSAMEITTSYILTGKLEESQSCLLSKKYVVLAWSGSSLISCSHTDITTGSFSVICPAGILIDKLDFRNILDVQIGLETGSWNSSTDIGAVSTGTTSIVSSKNENGIKIYPVPARDNVTICFTGKQSESVNITLITLTGHVIFRRAEECVDQVLIDVSGFPDGIYLLIGNTREGKFVYKLPVIKK
ncbi:MAG: T9SS type A sorting domain-containing protein [Bacteroidales bacterium]